MTKRTFQDMEEEFLKSLIPKHVLTAVEIQKTKEQLTNLCIKKALSRM